MFKRIFAVSLLALSAWTSSMAVPAYPKPVTVTQPDGSQVVLILRGDERVNWAETTDGYTLLRDAKGYWSFAQQQDGQLVASALRFDGSTAKAQQRGIEKGLRYSANQVEQLRQSYHAAKRLGIAAKAFSTQDDLMVDKTFPTTGKRKLLCLLVNFGNTKTTITRQQFNNMMNQQGYKGIGSFRDYYLEQSYGQLDIDVTVTDWVKLTQNKATYGVDNMYYIIEEALKAVADTLDLAQFDNDGDGILDGLAVIHQGVGQEVSGSSDDIWSHSDRLEGLKVKGITIRRYTIEPEMLTETRMSNIGVFCHEFGHNLGAPDFYDADYESSGGEYCGTGVWDLLGSGAWNGTYGDQPAGINGWQKWVYGWLEPTVLSESTTVSAMPAADQKPVAYRFETGNPGEYIFLENRQQTGTFDGSLPGHGLIAYHVNENLIKARLNSNTVNALAPQGIYTVCSDAGADPDSQPLSFGNINSDGAPFPGAYGHTSFSDNTLPSTKAADGRYAYCSLEDIAESNGTISFRFVKGDAPAQPENLTATTKNGNVTLTWQLPANAGQVANFTIYRDDVKIGTTTSTSYVDQGPDGGKMLTYQVDATYSTGLVSHPSEVSIMVPVNRLTALTSTTEGGGATLQWTTNNKLSWSNNSNGKLITTDYVADELEYASHFTAADLSTYVGGKITKMSFLPAQGPSTLTVKFRVYEADANGKNPQLVSERNVKEFANGQPRELTLTTPVTIQAGKDYYVAVSSVSSNGVVVVTTDQEDVIEGRGNCLLKNGEFVEDAAAAGNYYISATVTPSTTATGATATVPDNYESTADLFFPRGFVVYRDGSLIATVTDRSYNDTQATVGTHTYTVACIYAGGNEAKALTKTVTVSSVSGIETAEASAPQLQSTDGGIRIAGAHGRMTVVDAQGRLQSVVGQGSDTFVELRPGLYIVSTGGSHQPVKMVVK